MKFKHKICLLGYTSWCCLGFMRGINYYNYTHYKYEKNQPYFYTSSFLNGIFGIIMYGNPILIPITLYKEIYRLEINVRNLESEKKSKFYNDLF